MQRMCGVRLTLPSIDGKNQVMFVCNQPRLHEGDHREQGRVRVGQEIEVYAFRWWKAEEEREVWRSTIKS